jgi:pseudaminic acid cytidylyltransferase
MTNTVTAIIPARSGSKRIKDKNITLIKGKPILGRVIENLAISGIFANIFVSTDSQRYADIASEYGANPIPLRDIKLSDDHSTIIDVMRYEVDRLNIKTPYTACVYATSLTTRPSVLADAFTQFTSSKNSYDFLLPVKKYPHPIERALKTIGCTIQMTNEGASRIRTQDLEEKYYDTGQFIFGKTPIWKSCENLWDHNVTWLDVTREPMIDLDTADDLISLNQLLEGKN